MSWMGWVVIGIIGANVAFFTPLIIRHIMDERREDRHGNRAADR